MKVRTMIVAGLAAIGVVSQPINTSSAGTGYSAQLMSPTAGQVLYPGQVVRVEWNHTLPDINLAGCEMEVWLSLDGGAHYTLCLTPHLDPHAKFFYWTVPNTPTYTAVLDVRFGCDLHYPESYAPQPASMFTIAKAGVPTY
jgi:hypothetical protein